MSPTDTKNPCIGRCRFDAAAECLGCHRTKAEAKDWKRLSDMDKAAINHRIRQRVRTQDAATRSPSKRLRKIDRKIRKLKAKLDGLQAERDALAGVGVPPKPDA